MTAARWSGTAPLRVGTRGSALAMAQAQTVVDALTARTGVSVTLVEIATAGDRSAMPVAQLGVGVFVSALRDALAAKEIDAAIHSYKDLPTTPDDRLRVAAVPVRANPRDALVTRSGLGLDQLPSGARIGTGAPRRMAQLRCLDRGLVPVPVRGNVDTRLRKLAAGEFEALVLAHAGLARLGRADEITETLDPAVMLPAPAQGALAVECRVDDDPLLELLSVLDHQASHAAVIAERSFMSTLEAGCSAPVAGLAEFGKGDELRLHGAVFDPDGRRTIRASRTVVGAALAEQLGRELATELLDTGARTILAGAGDRGGARAAADQNA